jgi:putative tricarboxylic transport membrane protein
MEPNRARGFGKISRIADLIWLPLSVFVCIESWGLKLKVGFLPGPGFFPFCIGILLGGLAVISTLQSFREKQILGSAGWAGANTPKIVLVLTVFFIYAAVLTTLGFVLSTFILTVFLLRVVEPLSWTIVFPVSILMTVFVYLFFKSFLGCPLPEGVYGF